jgi:hypothetical protein
MRARPQRHSEKMQHMVHIYSIHLGINVPDWPGLLLGEQQEPSKSALTHPDSPCNINVQQQFGKEALVSWLVTSQQHCCISILPDIIPAAHFARALTTGRAYASVLPEPVGAAMHRSWAQLRPPASSLHTDDWTGKSSLNPSSSGW